MGELGKVERVLKVDWMRREGARWREGSEAEVDVLMLV